MARKIMLVYQAGIANVFEVDNFQKAPDGRNARRLLQDTFDACQWFARGLASGGCHVITAGCNQAGDIANRVWTTDLDSLPFSEHFAPVFHKPD